MQLADAISQPATPWLRWDEHGNLLPPTSQQVRAARSAAGHTQAQAAALVFASRRAWQEWEREDSNTMPPGLWVLYLLRIRAITLSSLASPD